MQFLVFYPRIDLVRSQNSLTYPKHRDVKTFIFLNVKKVKTSDINIKTFVNVIEEKRLPIIYMLLNALCPTCL